LHRRFKSRKKKENFQQQQSGKSQYNVSATFLRPLVCDMQRLRVHLQKARNSNENRDDFLKFCPAINAILINFKDFIISLQFGDRLCGDLDELNFKKFIFLFY